MFLRVVRAAGGKGVKHEYIRLVEAYRDGGKTRHRTIVNLGRKDLIAPHLDQLNRLIRGAPAAPTDQDAAALQPIAALDWGPLLAVRHLWTELGLHDILDRLAGRRAGRDFSDRVLLLVASRLMQPSSEHGLARWLETSFACDRHGRRFLPAWRDDAERRASRSPRVRVAADQLQRWYRSLDRLIAAKPEIERQLYLRLRDLLSLRVDLAFYDLTSTYFEGAGPSRLGAHGYSRDHRPRAPQVLLGLVMVDGVPIAHHLFAGNRRDASTVPAVLDDLERRFGLGRVVFVGDRGMVTEAILQLLRARGQGYLVGRNRRRAPAISHCIEQATGPWLECPLGPQARAHAQPPRTLVQEVAAPEPGLRTFVVHSDERLAFERQERRKAMARVRRELAALQQRVAAGRLKAPEKVGAAAGRILARNHGHRYYDWTYQDGVFRYFEHPLHLPREQALEGKYVLQTEEPALSPVQAVQLYKELSRVEAAFRGLKDVIELRPVYHQTDRRVAAHVFVATLALLLECVLQRKLRAAGLDLSAAEALQTLNTVRLVSFATGDGRTRSGVTRGTPRAAAVLRALAITQLDPPAQGRTRM